jgi:hypothetical protein
MLFSKKKIPGKEQKIAVYEGNCLSSIKMFYGLR